MKENIESFLRQDYPAYEILFAADEPDDARAARHPGNYARRYPTSHAGY